MTVFASNICQNVSDSLGLLSFCYIKIGIYNQLEVFLFICVFFFKQLRLGQPWGSLSISSFSAPIFHFCVLSLYTLNIHFLSFQRFRILVLSLPLFSFPCTYYHILNFIIKIVGC